MCSFRPGRKKGGMGNGKEEGKLQLRCDLGGGNSAICGVRLRVECWHEQHANLKHQALFVPVLAAKEWCASWAQDLAIRHLVSQLKS